MKLPLDFFAQMAHNSSVNISEGIPAKFAGFLHVCAAVPVRYWGRGRFAPLLEETPRKALAAFSLFSAVFQLYIIIYTMFYAKFRMCAG